MVILTIANQKGGVGKTNTNITLAQFFALKMQRKVCVIDLDPQGNASYSLSEYEIGSSYDILTRDLEVDNDNVNGRNLALYKSSNLFEIESIDFKKTLSIFKSNLKKISLSYDVCIIDTGPAFSAKMTLALASSDYVLSPIECELYSMQGIYELIPVINNVQRTLNSKLVFLGMVASRLDSRNPRHTENFKLLKEKYPSYILPCVLGLRSSFSDALALKVPIWEIKKTAARKAADEAKKLSEYIATKIFYN